MTHPPSARTPRPLFAAGLVLALLGCAAPEAAQPGAAQPDAGQPSDGGPVPDCSPACTAPLTTCVAHACVCTPLAHDGGDGSCVALNACADGFGQGGGDSTCRPVAEVCPPVACGVARAWMPGRCSYSPLPDGAACAGHSGDQCISQFECRTGQCVGLQNGCGARRPLVLVHGINGSSADFKVMKARFLADGWPESWIYLFDAADPKWGCNVDNAAAIRALVERARAETCQPRVDIVAHSMGSLSSRYFLKDLQGAGLVNTYVTLGGPHHGLSAPCFAPGALGVCVWKELCESGDFIKELNTAPVIVGHGPWVSIYGTADTTIPNASSQLAGAENIAMPGVEHYGPKGLNEDAATYAQVLRVLGYPCW